MTPEQEAGFTACVLRWLRESQKMRAVRVEKVTGYGADMAGSTEGGFYPSFSVDIKYIDETGAAHTENVEGEAMSSLWSWVVREWPAGT